MNFLKKLSHETTEDCSLYIEVLKNQLKENEVEIHILREKVATHEYMKEQVNNLKIQIKDHQQTLEHITENQKQCYDYISRNLDIASIKYKETLINYDKLQHGNRKLKCSIQFNTLKVSEIINNIENLKIMNLKAVKCNNKIQKETQKYQVIHYYYIVIVLL